MPNSNVMKWVSVDSAGKVSRVYIETATQLDIIFSRSLGIEYDIKCQEILRLNRGREISWRSCMTTYQIPALPTFRNPTLIEFRNPSLHFIRSVDL